MALYGYRILGSRKKSNFYFLRFSACLSDLIVLKNEILLFISRTKNITNLLSVSPRLLVNYPGKMRMSTLLNFIVGNKTVELHFFNFSNVLSVVIVSGKGLSD